MRLPCSIWLSSFWFMPLNMVIEASDIACFPC
jgi:hypothetical protein